MRSSTGRFPAATRCKRGQPVLYVTERCVFELTQEGLELIEVAPGIDIERDILARMEFRPIIRRDPAVMDRRIFSNEPMGLRDDLLRMPLEQRFTYHPQGKSVLRQFRRPRGSQPPGRRADPPHRRIHAVAGRAQGLRHRELRQFRDLPRLDRRIFGDGARSCRSVLLRRHALHDQRLSAHQAGRCARTGARSRRTSTKARTRQAPTCASWKARSQADTCDSKASAHEQGKRSRSRHGRESPDQAAATSAAKDGSAAPPEMLAARGRSRPSPTSPDEAAICSTSTPRGSSTDDGYQVIDPRTVAATFQEFAQKRHG